MERGDTSKELQAQALHGKISVSPCKWFLQPISADLMDLYKYQPEISEDLQTRNLGTLIASICEMQLGWQSDEQRHSHPIRVFYHSITQYFTLRTLTFALG